MNLRTFSISLVWACAGLLTIWTPRIDASNPAGDIETLLRAEFSSSKPGRALVAKQKGTRASVELCFDQCDYFEWKGSLHDLAAWDFIALFELETGVGSTAEGLKEALHPRLDDILARTKLYCSKSSDVSAAAKCTWKRFAESLSMRAGITTYSEGLRCSGWRDPKSMTWPTKTKCEPISESPWKGG